MKFELLQKLPESALNGKSIVLTVVATVEGNSDLVGYTVVIISLPEIDDVPTIGRKKRFKFITIL